MEDKGIFFPLVVVVAIKKRITFPKKFHDKSIIPRTMLTDPCQLNISYDKPPAQ